MGEQSGFDFLAPAAAAVGENFGAGIRHEPRQRPHAPIAQDLWHHRDAVL